MTFLNLVHPLLWLGPSLARAAEPLARSLLARLADRLSAGECTLILPSGAALTLAGHDEPELRAVLRLRRLRSLRRLVLRGDVGFAEAYIDGDWDTPDLVALLRFAAANEDALQEGLAGHSLWRGWDRVRHRLRRNSRRGSRRNIAAHYDISNAFYGTWLDAELTYSSALFTDDSQTLEAAQQAKYHQLARLLRLAPGQHVLEIGCGWGAFAILAARDYGCRVTAITLSREQQAHAAARIAAEGLGDRIDVRLEDYRDVRGVYDRIASIEMLEAVGEAYWPRFFEVLRQRLCPGGIAALQVITIADDRFARYRRGADFIQCNVFPGGMLPSPKALRAAIGGAGLRLGTETTFAPSYARTLELWRERFEGAWPQIAALGFDERFRRLWRYYLAYCEVGFRTGAIDVGQYQIFAPPLQAVRT